MISLSQLLQGDRVPRTEFASPERRIQRRIRLGSTPGVLLFERLKMPCQLTDISMTGCGISVDKRFSEGALARIEIMTSIQGQPLHIYGITTWTRNDRLIGVRFTHPSLTIKKQVETLVAALIELSDTSNLDVIDGSFDDSEEDENRAAEDTRERFSAEFIRLIHNSGCRAVSWQEGEWPAQIRYISDRSTLTGSILDLSVHGCSIQTSTAFSKPFHENIELSFTLRGLPFLLAGKAVAVDSPNTVGIQFSAISTRRLEELKQLIGELRASGKYQPDSLKDVAEEPTVAAEEETAASQPEPMSADAALSGAVAVPTGTEPEEIPEEKHFWSQFRNGNWE